MNINPITIDKHNQEEAVFLNIVTMVILAIVSLTIMTNFGIAQAQVTAQQKAKVCDPNDRFINTTESKICGIPPTPANTTSTSSTGTEGSSAAPPLSAAPGS